jgi:hypothetical protein
MIEKVGHVEIEIGGDSRERRVVLRGRFDETAELATRASSWAAPKMTIDTADITFINSIGVREWMRLLRALGEHGAKLRLERVAEVIIEQINMIEDARGSAEVMSFHAPYVCNACGLEASMLVDVGKDGAAMRRMETPAQSCPDCGKAMELYEVPEKFFSFLVLGDTQ